MNTLSIAISRGLGALTLAAFAPAHAAERGYSVTDFDRIRVDGPYKVSLATGRSPGARAFGSQQAIEGVSVELQGRTLVVRRGNQAWGGYPGRSAGSVELKLTTFGLRAASLNGAGSLVVDKIKGQSVDLIVAGSGTLTVGALETDRLAVAVVGNGRAVVAGKAAMATIGVRGTAAFDGSGLVVQDAKLAADGPGDIRVAAVRTASVSSNGAGNVIVTGDPACTVKSAGSGTVSCGR